jgi:D-alanyl-D-alanine carboxypeptidase
MRKLKLLLTVGFILCIALSVTAQDMTITGTVRDAGDNTPLPGVSVRVKGMKTGTTTNATGTFTIAAQKGKILVFSFIGYRTVEVTVGDNTVINLSLTETSEKQELSEVIVTAMDIKRTKREVGYATQSVEGKEIQETQRENFVNALQGRIEVLPLPPQMV